MAKVVQPALKDHINNIKLNTYSYNSNIQVPEISIFEDPVLEYANVSYNNPNIQVAELTSAFPADTIISTIYDYVEEEITNDYDSIVEETDDISSTLENTEAMNNDYSQMEETEEEAPAEGAVAPAPEVEDSVEEQPAEESVEEQPAEETQSEETHAEESTAEEETLDEEPAAEEPAEEEDAIESNPYANSFFTPSITEHDDGSYTVSSSTDGFNAESLATDKYYYEECAFSARMIASKRYGGVYFSVGLGDAKDMAANARARGIYNVSKTPTVGSIITFQPRYLGADRYKGHAAYVDAITYNADGSIKSITIVQTHYSDKGTVYTYSMEEINNHIDGIDFITPKIK